MKKLFILFLTLCLALTALAACDDSTNPVDSKFSSEPFYKVEEGVKLSEDQLKSIISDLPDEKYESYPDLQNIPLSAVLYKNGEKITLDPADPRVIALVNLFNNSVYTGQCSYTQGYLPADEINSYKSEDFRLELKYEPSGNLRPAPYGKNTMMCDTIIVSNAFLLINHDYPGYADRAEEYPITGVAFSPLHNNYPWLELFGF